MKKCPFCAETIQDDAVICRFCGKELPAPVAGAHHTKRGSRKAAIGLALLVILLLIGGLVFLAFFSRQQPSRPVLLQIDFENPAAFAGWHTGAPGQGPFWLENTQDGKYLFEFPSGFVENEDYQFNNVEISMDVAFLSQARTDATVTCRSRQGEGYGFRIANSGDWQIYKSYQSQWIDLASGWSDQIKANKNRLAGRCVGDQLTLLVNGVEIATASDADLSMGGINLNYNSDATGAGTFDNLLVEDWGNTTATPNVTELAAAFTATPIPPTATLAPSQTSSPTIVTTPTQTPEGLFYANQFNDESDALQDWTMYQVIDSRHFNNDADPNISLVDQRLHLEGSNGQPLYMIYDMRFPNEGWNIGMKMKFINEGKAQISLICNYSAAGWYEFGVASDGTWQIRRSDSKSETDFTFTTLAEGTSEAITAGQNSIKIGCVNENLSLKVNNETIAEVVDPTPLPGDIYGTMYYEAQDSDIAIEISEILLTTPDGNNIKEFTQGQNSFYFSLGVTAIFYGWPHNVLSIIDDIVNTQVEDGQFHVTLENSGAWMAISPNIFPANVEFSADVDTSELADYSFGVGIMCRWDDTHGGYAIWYVEDHLMTTPVGFTAYGLPSVNGPAEFSVEDKENILEGSLHHVTARCWNDKVEMYVDGNLISSHAPASFPYEGNFKSGKQVGLFVTSTRGIPVHVSFDNLMVSWNMATPEPAQ